MVLKREMVVDHRFDVIVGGGSLGESTVFQMKVGGKGTEA